MVIALALCSVIVFVGDDICVSTTLVDPLPAIEKARDAGRHAGMHFQLVEIVFEVR